jgi:hypothetical protein
MKTEIHQPGIHQQVQQLAAGAAHSCLVHMLGLKLAGLPSRLLEKLCCATYMASYPERDVVRSSLLPLLLLLLLLLQCVRAVVQLRPAPPSTAGAAGKVSERPASICFVFS